MNEFHYVLTLQLPAAGGVGMVTRSGTYRPAPGQTRAGVLAELMQGYERANVVFWSLEPNELAGGAA